jgi:hypothetical protein
MGARLEGDVAAGVVDDEPSSPEDPQPERIAAATAIATLAPPTGTFVIRAFMGPPRGCPLPVRYPRAR